MLLIEKADTLEQRVRTSTKRARGWSWEREAECRITRAVIFNPPRGKGIKDLDDKSSGMEILMPMFSPK
jgi:hypothetical protein